MGPVGATSGAQTHSPGLSWSARRASSAGELTFAPWAYNGTLPTKVPARIAMIHGQSHLLAALRCVVFISFCVELISRTVTQKYQRIPDVGETCSVIAPGGHACVQTWRVWQNFLSAEAAGRGGCWFRAGG